MTTGVALLDGIGTSEDERHRFLETLALRPGARLLEAEFGATEGPDGRFDAVLCIDAIACMPDREKALSAWARLVKPGGRILYTDPAIVAGLVTSDELATRSSMGLLVYSSQGDNELLIESSGLRLLRADDATSSMSLAAERLHLERAGAEAALVAIEGRDRYDARQRFLAVTHRLASERRLARIAFLAERHP